MKTKIVYKFVVSLLLLTLLFSTGGSITQASTTDTIFLDEYGCCLQTGANQIDILSQEDPYLIALKLTAEVKSAEDNFGTLLWDQAYLQSTEGNPWHVITVPIESKHTKETQLLFAGTQDGNTFRILVFGLEVENPAYEDAQQSFSGSFKFYVPTGKLIFMSEYQDGILTEVVNQTDEVKGLDWGCFLSCIGENIPTYCLTSCIICAGAAVPTNPFCIACAGCIGYGAFICIVRCWR
jgi:hypothetical protein